MGDATPPKKPIELTPLELRVLLLLRALKPYEKIEVKYEKQGEIKVTHQCTVQEVFPVEKV